MGNNPANKNATENILVFSSSQLEEYYFDPLLKDFNVTYLNEPLNLGTIQKIIKPSILLLKSCDTADGEILKILNSKGVNLICLRTVGYNNVDIEIANELGITVTYVPEYSPESIAEQSILLMLASLRKLKETQQQMSEGNFTHERLLGKTLQSQKIGIIGTGRIGIETIKILNGFGSKIVAYDLFPDQAKANRYNFQYTQWEDLIQTSDIISLYIPMTESNRYLINKSVLDQMKSSAVLINISRGELLDTQSCLNHLSNKKLASIGLDVYENEKRVFFKNEPLEKDLLFEKLMSHPKVIVTPHTAYLTETSLENIASTVTQNIIDFINGRPNKNFLS